MSNNGLLGNNFVTQIGILVHDIEAVSRRYADFFGIEQPNIIVTGPMEIAQTENRGEPTPARAKLAFFNMGSLQLELIEPDEHPSAWREYLDEHGEGPHHIAFVIEGMKEKVSLLEGKGMQLLMKGEYTGGRFAYVDTFNELKVMIELLENDK
ncbi:VOC family protein [Paenibacillus rhizovicinus]|uniref:VOC family protein n=1 Tax=Paenibacillus rhizovicinus TaxID=2704463 RepID=A0A6C0NX85_9BACL|nr:VOC family protein [Paenibacillus rhizovicinus]QHW30788.1 VOC family protein [Paenibacillus rhizovicinus]